jgi:hypothetical protein
MPPSSGSLPFTPSTVTNAHTAYEQTQKAIDAMQNKLPVPDIDFTIHKMEDGAEVSTLERVCKGNGLPSKF